MIRVAFVRGAFLNNFEGQNYIFDQRKVQLTAFSSFSSMHKRYKFNVVQLPSLTDFHLPRAIANRTLGDAHILFELEKYAEKFDIFHTADPHYYYSYQLAKLRKEGKIKRLISTSWETIPNNNETVRRKKYIKYFTMNYVDKFLCYTDRAKTCLVSEGVESKRIAVIPLGVDLSQFKPGKGKRKDRMDILFVGRLVKEKGVMDLVEAVKSLRLKNVHVEIIGQGPLKRKLSKVESFSVSHKEYDDMPLVYRSADIFVHPAKHIRTWEEQYGMVVVEAMASGLPVVVNRSGAIPELVGNAGITVREGDIKGLAAAIRKLLSDDSGRLKLGTMARRRAERYFDSRKTARKIQKLYETVSRHIV